MRDEQKEYLEQALVALDEDLLFLRTQRDAMAAALANKGGRVQTVENMEEVWYVTVK